MIKNFEDFLNESHESKDGFGDFEKRITINESEVVVNEKFKTWHTDKEKETMEFSNEHESSLLFLSNKIDSMKQ